MPMPKDSFKKVQGHFAPMEEHSTSGSSTNYQAQVRKRSMFVPLFTCRRRPCCPS